MHFVTIVSGNQLHTMHSRSTSDAEKRYPQIDKEALAVTYACERFSDLPIGMYFKIETDHKPLVALLGKKDLDVLPPKVQRFRMYFMRYDYTIAYVQRKEHVSADALSGAPVDEEDPTLHEVSQAFVNQVISSLPSSTQRVNRITQHQREDETYQLLHKYCTQGWPRKVHGILKQYQPVSSEITVQNGLLLRAQRIIIPQALRMEILERLHEGHLGLVKCRRRASQSVWWPGLGNQIEEPTTGTLQSRTTSSIRTSDLPMAKGSY